MTREKIKENLKSMSLGDHLEELRIRMMLAIGGLLLGLVACLFFGKYLILLLRAPYDNALSNPEIPLQLQTIQPAEGFLTYIKICMVFGLLLTSPWVFWQVWTFVSAGLYRHEKKFVKIVAPISAGLFVTGAMFFILIVAPLAMGFFIKFNAKLGLQSNWTFQYYINMVLMLTLVFAMAFQMPIAIVFAEKMGLVSIDKLVAGRRYVAVVLVILAAVATPPDVISQISLFIPMYILYEGSIIACRFMRKKKAHPTE
ncbi:MAG: twin-arginine translocase subunit TatC [Phycisphaerae bacterium]|nr:twin-arginine translocase subunit TatC [Phycisphaerae bacterium]